MKTYEALKNFKLVQKIIFVVDYIPSKAVFFAAARCIDLSFSIFPSSSLGDIDLSSW